MKEKVKQHSLLEALETTMPAKTQKRPAQKKPQGAVVRKAPVAIGTVMTTPQYKFSSTGNGITISHREYLGSLVTTNSAFETCQTYAINAGDHTTFPWLMSIARNFGRYRMKAVKALWISEAATTTTGTIMLSYSTDPADLNMPPTSKVAMMEYASSLRCAPWENATLTAKLSHEAKYVRPGNNYYPVSTTANNNATDPRTVADGVLLVSASNVALGTPGDIFIEYVVELMDPVSALARPIGNAQCTTAASALFGTAGVVVRVASEVFFTFAANTLSFTYTGECLLMIGFTASASATAIVPTVSTGCTLVTSSIALNTVSTFKSWILLSLVCTGPTTITEGAMTNLAASVTKVILAPYESSTLGTAIFP
jgi:hypothetical protein